MFYIFFAHLFHYATVFSISGSETSQEWSHKQVKRVCIYSVHLSRRCPASPRKYGSQGSALPPPSCFSDISNSEIYLQHDNTSVLSI